MLLPLAVLLLAQAAQAQDDELVRAATNPYDLARFIDSHLGFDWSVLWKALGTPGTFIQPCGKPSNGLRGCSTEVIGVQNPDQAIVLVVGDSTPADAYIRYLKQPDGSWKFSGVQAAFIRNHPRRHEVDRSSGTPYLRVARQGIYGSDVDSEIEVWYDLSQPSFEPIFTFVSQGHQQRFAFGIGRTVFGVMQPAKYAIDVTLQVEFFGTDGYRQYSLGVELYRARYVRPDLSKPFSPRMQESKVSGKEFEALADLNQGPSDEDLIRLDLHGLTEVATGKDAAAKTWLRDLLKRCKDTPEVRKLKALLPK